MNRMWSVFTAPCLVETVVPSISGSRSRCTPSRDTSAPTRPSRAGDLVDLVEEHDAVVLDRLDRLLHELVLVEQLVGFLADQGFVGFLHGDAARLGALPPILPKISPIEMAPICAPGMPGISNIGMPPPDGCTSISISLSFSSPARKLLAERVLGGGGWRPGRPARRRTRSSAACSARACTSLRLRSRVSAMPTSTRSRTICSTSRPT